MSMESHGIPGKIQCSDVTHSLIEEKFITTCRGSIPVKGKGEMITYLVCPTENRTSNNPILENEKNNLVDFDDLVKSVVSGQGDSLSKSLTLSTKGQGDNVRRVKSVDSPTRSNDRSV